MSAMVSGCAELGKAPKPSPSGGLVKIEPRQGLEVRLEYKKPLNITGKRLYPPGFSAYCTPAVLEALSVASSIAARRGLGITVLDAWRPPVASALLWNEALLAGAREFFAPPSISGHTRGASLDVTLHRLGDPSEDLPMPTAYDYTGPPQAPAAGSLPNAVFLKETMVAAGFEPYGREWWHFDHRPSMAGQVVESTGPLARRLLSTPNP